MVERTKVSALIALASIVALLVIIAFWRTLEYLKINPLLVAWVGIVVFAFVWIYDAITENPS